MLELLLQHGSMALVFLALMAGGLGLPVPEDLVLLAAGALWHRGLAPGIEVLPLCFLGVLSADLLLFSLARHFGPKALEHRYFKRMLTPERQRHVDGLFERHGGKVIFFARYTGPFRAPAYAMAGLRGMALSRFLFWDALALCLSIPAVCGLGYLFSEHLDHVLQGMASARHWTELALVAAVLLWMAWRSWRRRGA